MISHTVPLGDLDHRQRVLPGRPFVLRDADSTDGYLVFPASRSTVETMAFAVRHTSGFLCVALPGEDCDRLGLPPMRPHHGRGGLAYTVSVDARAGITTGISARDRCHTARLLADAATTADDLVRPGHVMVAAASGTGSTADIASDLVAATGCGRAAVFGAIVGIDDPTRMADRAELAAFAAEHGLALVTSAGRTGPSRELLVSAAAR